MVDLKHLAVDRSSPKVRGIAPPPRIWSRYVLPGALIVGFLGVIAWSARDSLLPAKAVTVMPVIFSETAMQTEGAPLFKAAGWVEPRPTVVQATALAEGVVERLLVIEGQRVKQGQEVARLIDRDAELALAEAKADLALKGAELQSAKAASAAAETTLQYPVQLQAALAEAEAMLARAQNELATLPLQIQAAEAKLRFAEQDYEGNRDAGDAVSGRSLQRSQSALDAARAMLDELKARQPRLELETEAQQRRRDALQKQLDLKTDEIRAVAETKAAVAAAEARLQQAEVAVDIAQLRFDRMSVRAPSDGVILALVAQPGKRVMGQSALGEPEASTVVTLYDPQRLQLRADVRLEDVPKVQLGQRVEIETPSAGKPLAGEVLAITSITDIQKNTLQVKVTIEDPPDRVKPDMLVQVTFLAPKSDTSAMATSHKMRVFVPRSLVESGEGGNAVWVADLTAGVARRKPVQLGAALPGGLVEVEGLTPADKLIVAGRESLEDGDRIRVTGDDTSLEPSRP
ncbi:MAG: efflux RND transporter periplasmic adaptor subunit [Pirellulales bacterium]